MSFLPHPGLGHLDEKLRSGCPCSRGNRGPIVPSPRCMHVHVCLRVHTVTSAQVKNRLPSNRTGFFHVGDSLSNSLNVVSRYPCCCVRQLLTMLSAPFSHSFILLFLPPQVCALLPARCPTPPRRCPAMTGLLPRSHPSSPRCSLARPTSGSRLAQEEG